MPGFSLPELHIKILPTAIRLVEATPANLAAVKRFLAPPEPSSMPVGLQNATLGASRIVVARIAEITPLGTASGPYRNLKLDVIQSLKGDTGGQLNVQWVEDPAKSASTLPGKSGAAQLIFLRDDWGAICRLWLIWPRPLRIKSRRSARS